MKLLDDVQKFREMIVALIASEVAVRTMNFKASFPNGQCLNASQMLAKYLSENGCENVQVMSGTCPKLGSHAWVEVGKLIVDITADQYEKFGYPSVFIGENSRLHSNFSVKPSFQQTVGGDLVQTYLQVLKFENITCT
ncbi:lasso peptide biosynthesis protein [Moritella sp.]|uniref:lasso peptide biosynthesis protein n=1 Tax=Moritella sp. TaxID=78556 RepID=UPI0025CDA33E|nr:lasso peptide biosynthesis protein [Moritella sp.]MCJ8351377.1 lasso peptide biosynthesis protein [Moritella sp.]